jgi:hypothetical protein
MTKPVKTKTTRLLVSLRDDIERFLDALFGELDRLRPGADHQAGGGADPRADEGRSRTALHARGETISDARDTAPRGRRSVPDRSPGEISMSSRSRRVGESHFQDLPRCRS